MHRLVSADPSSAYFGLMDFPQVDVLGVRYGSVNFRAKRSPVSPDWRAQIDSELEIRREGQRWLEPLVGKARAGMRCGQADGEEVAAWVQDLP